VVKIDNLKYAYILIEGRLSSSSLSGVLGAGVDFGFGPFWGSHSNPMLSSRSILDCGSFFAL
jgi:hypothetical protein